MTKPLTIGALSKASGVTTETIRYYERTGLLPTPTRTDSGYRHYADQDISRLRFIRRGRELGFPLEDLKMLLQLAEHPDRPCHAADTLARRHLAEIEARIQDLECMRQELSRLIDCQSDTAAHCRLIEALACQATAETGKAQRKPKPE